MKGNFRNIALSLMAIVLPMSMSAQDMSTSKFSMTGYISNMQSVMFTKVDGEWINDNLFHNRVNLYWYPTSSLTASVQFRNRFMYGQTIEMNPGYAIGIDNENAFLDLSLNIFNKKSFFLNSTIDRAYIEYTSGKFVATAGRQRINWGQSFVWNPNDIFNVQNYFDFDYIEKPGSDAVRFQYYTGYASDIELAAKLDGNNKLTAAGYYRFNKWDYDFQVLGGIFAQSDYVAGLGWSGSIKGAGFRGETSYFRPKNHFRDTTGLFYFDLSGDYTFSNSLYVQLEGLYARLPGNFNINNFLMFYQNSLTVKQLAFSEWNIFGNVSYPMTPLLNVSLAGMYFPNLKGYYAGPNIDYSLKDNMKLSFIMQIFSGKFPAQGSVISSRTNYYFGFLRYKFSF
ncbi:MAG TPA: hypothetical protein VE870_17695 [Bacteroidales bacterium]|nr:hypothetical protein [Bacteroidales bacterium]